MVQSKNFLILILFMFSIVEYSKSQELKSILHVEVVDHSSKELTPVRVKITDNQGHTTALPNEAISIMYGRNDKSEGYGYQPDSSFYVDGKFTLHLKEGKYNMSFSKGMEYLDQIHTVELKKGKSEVRKIEMKRWINMADSGWYSADDHIHVRRSPRENPLLIKWIEAENLNVGVMLQMGDLWTTYFSQYAFGEEGVHIQNKSMLTSGQEEPRTHEVGHTIAMAADSFVRFKEEYYLYNKVYDQVHELNGVWGYAHQGKSFKGFRGMTMDVLDDGVDFLEILQFCVYGGPLITDNYYHFLDLGYKLTATAGSDFPWCGNGPDWNSRIGDVRFYTHIEGEFDYRAWKKNLASGHTFVSSGPMLNFKVNDFLPGDEIDLKKAGTITISTHAYGHKTEVPLTKLEIVSHGKVIKEITPNKMNQTSEHLSTEFDLEVTKGLWIAARCFAGNSQVAHTTPIYVSVNNSGFHNEESIESLLLLNEKFLDELEEELGTRSDKVDRQAWWYKDGLKRRIDKTRDIIKTMKSK